MYREICRKRENDSFPGFLISIISLDVLYGEQFCYHKLKINKLFQNFRKLFFIFIIHIRTLKHPERRVLNQKKTFNGSTAESVHWTYLDNKK